MSIGMGCKYDVEMVGLMYAVTEWRDEVATFDTRLGAVRCAVALDEGVPLVDALREGKRVEAGIDREFWAEREGG